MVRLPLAKRNGICAGSTDEPNSPQPMAGALEHRSFSSYDKLLLYTAFAKLLWRDLSQPVWKSFILFSLSEKNKILSLVCSEVRFLCLYVKTPHVCLVEPEKNSHLDKDLNFTGLFCTWKEAFPIKGLPEYKCHELGVKGKRSRLGMVISLQGDIWRAVGYGQALLLESSFGCERRGETGNWNSSSHLFWNKNTENSKKSPVRAKVRAGCRLLEAP